MSSGSNLHWVDYVVIVGYFALVIAVGIISSIKVVNIQSSYFSIMLAPTKIFVVDFGLLWPLTTALVVTWWSRCCGFSCFRNLCVKAVLMIYDIFIFKQIHFLPRGLPPISWSKLFFNKELSVKIMFLKSEELSVKICFWYQIIITYIYNLNIVYCFVISLERESKIL